MKWRVYLWLTAVLVQPATPRVHAPGQDGSYPLRPGQTLVIGFLGGAERRDDDRRSVRKLALALRAGPGAIRTETFANIHAGAAWDLISAAFDFDRNGVLDSGERARARIILYGQSLGASAAIRLARRLCEHGVPVLLTVQVDSVGLGDAEIPPNVLAAANFYQPDRFGIHGEGRIRAENPARTRILANERWSEAHAAIDDSQAGWLRRTFGGPHARMERDTRLWARVKSLILQAAS